MTRLQLWEVETAAQQVAGDVMRDAPVTVVSVALLDQPSFALTVRAVSTARPVSDALAVGHQVPLARAPWHRRVLERREPVLLEEGSPDRSIPPDEANLTLLPGLRTIFLMPMVVGGEIVGILALGEMRSPEREPFTEERRRRCLAALEQAISASSPAWEISRLRHQLWLMSSLLHIARQMLHARSYEDILGAIGSRVSDWLGAPVRAILLRAYPGGLATAAARWQCPEVVTEVAAGQLLLAIARSEGSCRGLVQVVRVADDPLDPFHAMPDTTVTTRVSLPFMQADRLFGAVCLYVEDDLRPSNLELGVFDWIAQITEVSMTLLAAVLEHREERDWLRIAASELLTTHQRTVVHEALGGVWQFMAGTLLDRLDRLPFGPPGGETTERSETQRLFTRAVIGQIGEFLAEFRHRMDGASISFVPTEVNELVRRAVEIVRARCEAGSQMPRSPVRVEFEPFREPMLVQASVALVGALTHAIDNAVEAVPEGGQVRVRTYRDDGHVVISVTDSGSGIPEDRRREVFAPFVSTKEPPHLGLGLTVLRAWILKHGGQVDLVSPGGGGTELMLRLPVLRDEARGHLEA